MISEIEKEAIYSRNKAITASSARVGMAPEEIYKRSIVKLTLVDMYRKYNGIYLYSLKEVLATMKRFRTSSTEELIDLFTARIKYLESRSK